MFVMVDGYMYVYEPEYLFLVVFLSLTVVICFTYYIYLPFVSFYNSPRYLLFVYLS